MIRPDREVRIIHAVKRDVSLNVDQKTRLTHDGVWYVMYMDMSNI